mmetsp:Transcript_37715/g.88243  ORF Transcript_37715/g.88243 Transcript_37715/m.88243 type:complete len:261 (-) Transcript_37715:808-1590(-)
MEASSAFSTLRILPRRGSTACVSRARPCLAEPPAESPSTMKISVRAASALEQSASLPGRTDEPSTLFLRTSSRAALAASAALAAAVALSKMAPSTFGLRCKYSARCSASTSLTMARTSGLPSRFFVCPSNSASPMRTATTAHSPSRTNSPASDGCFSRSLPAPRATRLTTRVMAALRPSMWVPPFGVCTPLAKPSRLSVYMSEFQRSAMSTCTPLRSAVAPNVPPSSAKSGFLPSQMWATYSRIPPRCKKICSVDAPPFR